MGDENEKLAILGQDVGLLISTIDYNLGAAPSELRFQRKVAYDQLPPECLPEFKKLVNRHGQVLLEQLNEFLATHDLDGPSSSPSPTSDQRFQAGVGIYYFEEPVAPKEKDPETPS